MVQQEVRKFASGSQILPPKSPKMSVVIKLVKADGAKKPTRANRLLILFLDFKEFVKKAVPAPPPPPQTPPC